MAAKLGLIAGNRSFPLHVARAAKNQGYEVVAVGLREETDPALESEVDRMHWLAFSEIGRVPELLRADGVREVILAGQIRPERLLDGEERMGEAVKRLLRLIPDRSGSSAMQMAVSHLEARGFRVLHSGVFLKEWIPARGVLSRRAPDRQEREDLRYGMPLARRLARWRVGQTVVIRRRSVVAAEAMEGTDEAIRRAAGIAGEGCVVVKACEPGHDMRFDIPVVGLSTLKAMEQARASCIGVEAGRVLLFQRPQLLAEADRAGIAVVAV